MVGREGWIASGGAEEVEGDEHLWQELVPEVEVEEGIGAIDARNHVIFEGAYCPFTCVASMASYGGELEINALVMHTCN